MVHVLDSNLNGFEHGFSGVPAAWATRLADDDVGPTREPMRASRLRGKERAVASRERPPRQQRSVSRRLSSRSRSNRRAA
jgi:hypothetical protein